MPTSASCPPPTEPRIARMRGFSLLEMLVVLVILGMAAALVAPSLSRTAERVRAAGDRDELVRRLGFLSAAVRAEGRDRHWVPGDALEVPRFAWPEGWKVHVLTALRVEASGFCAGGDVRVRGPGGERRYRLEAPDCQVVDADAP